MNAKIEHYRDYVIYIFPHRLILFYKGQKDKHSKRVAGIYCNRVTKWEIDQIKEIVDHIEERVDLSEMSYAPDK